MGCPPSDPSIARSKRGSAPVVAGRANGPEARMTIGPASATGPSGSKRKLAASLALSSLDVAAKVSASVPAAAPV